MRIYYEENNEVKTKVFTNITNLTHITKLIRELDEYDYWSEDRGDIVSLVIGNLNKDLNTVTKKLNNLTFKDMIDDLGVRDRLLDEQLDIAGQLQNLEQTDL